MTTSYNQTMLEPSRTLDLLVAEKLLGWFGVMNNPERATDAQDGYYGYDGNGIWKHLPRFSENIDDITIVISYLQQMGWDEKKSRLYQEAVQKVHHAFPNKSTQETLPLAMCVGALAIIEGM